MLTSIICIFFFKQKTAYEMRISDWSSDVCSSDLDVRFETGYNKSGFEIDDIELPTNTGRAYEGGNLAHRPRAKGGYFPVAPVDSAVDIRAEMVSTMLEMGLPFDKHPHAVAAAQPGPGLPFGTPHQAPHHTHNP